MEAVSSGSYLVISDTTTDIDTERVSAGTARLDARLGPARSTPRPRAAIARYFDGLDLVNPGLVSVPQWRTLANPLVIPAYAGMGRKP